MLFSLTDVQDYHLRSQEGDLGEIKSFLIDDFDWVLRYLIVEIDDREVLVSTASMGAPDPDQRVIPINLTRERIVASPVFDSGRPISRDIERRLSDYYEWPYYWKPDDVPDTLPGDLTAVPLIDLQLDKESQEDQAENPPDDRMTTASEKDQPHLRSTKLLFGLTIHATNDDHNTGKLVDMIVESEGWKILYLIIDTSGLMSNKKVLMPPNWVTRIDELNSRIDLELSAQTIQDAPEFNSIDDL